MIDIDQILNQLMVVQLSARALALQCEMLARQLTQESGSKAEDSDEGSDAPGLVCPHPRKFRDYSARVMGQEDRFFCRKCGEFSRDCEAPEPPSSAPGT